MATNPNDTWQSDLDADVADLLSDDTMDAALIASARMASEVMQSNRKLADSGLRQEQERQAEAMDRNSVALRANIVTKFYEPDRKMALIRMRNMRPNDVLVVGFEDANHLRVACNYQQNHHEKGFYTRSFMYGKRKYLEIKRYE